MHSQASFPSKGLGAIIPPGRGQAGADPVRLLQLLYEQGGIPLDQLARFLGCQPQVALAVSRRLRDEGCLELGRFIVEEPPWAWLRSAGARLLGARRMPHRPAALMLGHRRAVNEVRLRLEERAPHGRWLCEREVFLRRAPGDHIPDALFEIDDERHAIEVELSPKGERRTRQVIAEHSARYDAVVYFCGPATHRALRALADGGDFAKLLVRALPGEALSSSAAAELACLCEPAAPRPRRRAAGCRGPTAAGRLGLESAVTAARPRALPPGRHKLSREFVIGDQRRRLFEACLPLAAELGTGALNLSQVCARARVSRRTLYDHFGDSRGFRRAVDAEARALGLELPSCPPPVGGAPGWQARSTQLLAEQGLIAEDQLRRFLADFEDAPEDPGLSLAELGIVNRRRFFAGEPHWLWLTWSAAARAEPRFSVYQPKSGGLARLRALNEIRLKLEAAEPELRWTGWRVLRRQLRGAGRGNIPAAVVEIGAERHAIELEMRQLKTERQLVETIEHRSARYDAVVCFCARRPLRKLERLQAKNYWPRLVVRPLPGGDPRPHQHQPLPD